MIPAAPIDFWERVESLVAQFIYEREARLPQAAPIKLGPVARAVSPSLGVVAPAQDGAAD